MADMRETLIYLAAAMSTVCCIERADGAFSEQAQFGTGNTLSISWADADGDGDLDAGAAKGPAGELWTNNGDGTFTVSTPFVGSGSFALGFADADNDGDQDVAMARQAVNYLFTRNGDGTYTRAAQFGTGRSNGVAWADYDLDGDLDLAVAKGLVGTNQQSALYVNNGDGTWTQVLLSTSAQTAAVAWGDFDNDGDPDLGVARGGFGFVAQNVLLVNNGNGTFTEQAEFSGYDTTSLDWGDADNDGDLDVILGNWESGPNLLFWNNGDGTFTDGPALGQRDANTVAFGDVDQDGDLDVAAGNGDFAEADSNFVYINNGDGSFTEQFEFGLGSTDGLAFGDCDGDGDLDVAAANEHHPTQNYLYTNDAGAGSLRVHLVGHRHDLGAGYSNRDGIGARVTAYTEGHAGEAGSQLGLREIAAHAGFAAQNAVDAHLALPGHAFVDLVIRWPGSGGSHWTQILPHVDANQRLVVHEAPSAAGVDGSSTRPTLVLQVSPNPAVSLARVEVRGVDPNAPVRIQIADTSGRTIRSLLTTGPASIVWDLKDAGNALVPNGIYWVRAEGAGGAESARILVLR